MVEIYCDPVRGVTVQNMRDGQGRSIGRVMRKKYCKKAQNNNKLKFVQISKYKKQNFDCHFM